MGLITFRVKELAMTEETYESILSGTLTYEDLKDKIFVWSMNTFRSEDIKELGAFSPQHTLITFYNGDEVLAKIPHRDAKERLAKAIEQENKTEIPPKSLTEVNSSEEEEEDE